MREKIAPWVPAIFCAGLSLITVVADLAGRALTGNSDVGLMAFFCFLPMCFFFVGAVLKNLRDENLALKRKLDELLTK